LAASRALYPEQPRRTKAAPHPALFFLARLAASTRQAGNPARFTGFAGQSLLRRPLTRAA